MACVYAAMQYADWHTRRNFSPLALVVMLALAAWRGTLHLHAQPQLVAAFVRMT